MQNSIKALKINSTYVAPLSQAIQLEFNVLTETVSHISLTDWRLQNLPNSISVQDLIAYQIGWGKLLLYWYNAGTQNSMPSMPGEGFTKWDYKGLAQHFYKKYAYSNRLEQYQEFQQTVLNILDIVEKEYANDNLDKTSIWQWCRLASGKEWPLSKWIQVNTVAPYRRARSLIKKMYHT